MGRAAASSSLSTSCPPTHIFSSHPHSVTVSAAGIVLRRFTAKDPVIAACHASFIGDGREAASLAILHAAGRTLSVVGPGGALARVPLPTPAARMWALGPDRGLLLAGIGGGGLSLAHPLDAPEPVAGWGAGAGVVWASARDGLALTAAAAAAAGGDEVALWSLTKGAGGSGGAGGAPPAAAASPPLVPGGGATPGSARR